MKFYMITFIKLKMILIFVQISSLQYQKEEIDIYIKAVKTSHFYIYTIRINNKIKKNYV